MTEKRTTLEVIAPSVEEAIEKGLAELGLPTEAVEIEILDEGAKGLFGLGSRQTRVRLTIKAYDEPEPEADSPTEYLSQPAAKSVHTEPAAESSPEDKDRPLETARAIVADLLDKMGIKAEVTSHYGELDDKRRYTPVHVDIHGDDLSILIGRKAETIDALQYIARLIMGKELAQSIPLIVDVEGYRARREQQIRQLARRVAEQVTQTGHSQILEPMPPNERRFIHIELRDDPYVYTESKGEGSHRKVIVYPQE
ncbi:MAG: protein jag [Chloroflexi bacterium]|nr:protein jag [Chloroflexota bacterium]